MSEPTGFVAEASISSWLREDHRQGTMVDETDLTERNLPPNPFRRPVFQQKVTSACNLKQ